MKLLFFLMGLLIAKSFCYSQNDIFSLNLSLNNSFKTTNDGYGFQSGFYDGSYFPGLGIEYKKKLYHRLFLSAGFGYSPKGYTSGPLFSQRNGVFGFDYKYYEKKMFRFFELPVGVDWSFIKKRKYDFIIDGGIVNQLLFSLEYKPYDIINGNLVIIAPTFEREHKPEEQHLKYNDLKTAGFRTYNVALFGNIEFRYKIGEMFLSISPGFEYSFLPVTKSHMASYHQLADEYLYSYGITLKIISGINKN